MIVLDTNVLSELAKPDPDGSVLAWLARQRRADLCTTAISEAELAYGEPADEIVKWATTRGCDLVAMSTHGHRFISDLLYGSTADTVRHRVDVPVLLLKARK